MVMGDPTASADIFISFIRPLVMNLELLAPHQQVQKELAAIGEVGIEQAASLLISKYGLPIPIALS